MLLQIQVLTCIQSVDLVKVSVLEVVCILVEIFVVLSVKNSTKPTSNHTETYGHTQRDKCSCDLESSLASHGSIVGNVEVTVGKFRSQFGVVANIVPPKDDGAPNTTQQSRNTVQVVNTAGIVQSDALQKFGSEVHKAKRADDSGGKADHHGHSGSIDDGAGSTDDNSSCQSGVENALHFETVTV